MVVSGVLVGYTVTLQERVKLLYGDTSRTVVGVAVTEEPAWLGGGEETSLVILKILVRRQVTSQYGTVFF